MKYCGSSWPGLPLLLFVLRRFTALNEESITPPVYEHSAWETVNSNCTLGSLAATVE